MVRFTNHRALPGSRKKVIADGLFCLLNLQIFLNFGSTRQQTLATFVRDLAQGATHLA